MTNKYWFGPGCIEKDYQIFNDHKEFNIAKMQDELKNSANMVIAFQWNHHTNYIPWEFKMWIDKIIQYDIYNEKLIVDMIIHNGDSKLQNYLISVIESIEFIKAKLNIIWK